jgi:signal transduction histidine kinase
MARIEGQVERRATTLSAIQQNDALELVVQLKTMQLACEHQKLETALGDLQRAQAELLQTSKLTAIGQLAAGIAHEINTPMQFVGDNTHFVQRAFQMLLPVIQKLRAAPCPEQANTSDTCAGELRELQAMLKRAKAEVLCREVPRALEGSLEGISRVTSIVRAMKEFSHPSGGQLQPVNLNEAIQSTVEVTRNVWKYLASLDLELDPSLPPVPCLRDELNQVVLNLIVNASDAISDVTRGGTLDKGKIVVRTRAVGEFAEISITDSGGGIPESIRPRVFEPFFTTKAVGKGTGQGLAIAYSVVVDKHCGKIWLQSETGKGTTFFIQIPLAVAE